MRTDQEGWTHGRECTEISGKMNELVALGKKKKSILDVQEINDFFADMELSAEQMEKVFEYLEGHNIDVLRITADTDDDVDIDNMIAEEEEVDMENIDLSVPEGVSIEDPVRMYLKEIGKRKKKPLIITIFVYRKCC